MLNYKKTSEFLNEQSTDYFCALLSTLSYFHFVGTNQKTAKYELDSIETKIN